MNITTCRAGRLQAPALFAALLVVACGGDGQRPSPAAPAVPAAGAAVVSDAVTAAALPRPCRLGPGDPNAACRDSGSPVLLPYVEAAIDRLIVRKPQLFDFQDVSAPGTSLYKVLDAEGYLDGIVLDLLAHGACAQRDPSDVYYEKVLVKASAEFSEKYDVLTSDGYIRRGGGSFIDTCSPASFPIQRAPDVPPADSGCGRPYPPPVTRFACSVYQKGPDYHTLDSTPLVGPNVPYCAAIGYTDGRSFCPIRQHGAADRYACEIWRVGTADDTGIAGPTWTRVEGGYCTGPSSGCQVTPGNPFQLWAFVGGRYEVEADNGVACTVDVER